jgi:hypothetical protein
MTAGSAAYVRNYYRVPAKRGMRIVFDGTPAVITGFSNSRLLIRRAGDRRPVPVHPTWRIDYPTTEGA